jgi:hypothetical protein
MTAEIRHIVNGEVQSSDAATYRLKLPEVGSLHSILVRCSMTNGATAGRNVDIFDVVDDIRIVEGGRANLFQMHPTELEKWYETEFGKALDVVTTEAASGVQSAWFPIFFGRGMYDREYFLPVTPSKSRYLEIDYSPTITADGGFATGTFTLDVVYVISQQDEALPYRGTLVTRRVKEITTVASGEDATILNNAFPMRAIGVYVYEANTEDNTDVATISLEANDRRVKLFTLDWPEFLSFNETLFGAHEIIHNFNLLWQNADTIDVRLGRILSWSLSPVVASEIGTDTNLVATISALTGDRMTLSSSIVTETTTTTPEAADTTDRRYQLSVRGRGPSFFGIIPFLYQDSPDGYLKSNEYSNLTLFATQAGAGGTYSVITQELQQL